jgi:hypothetical protein
MDSFTIAVVIGGAAMLVILAGLVVLDKGAPAPAGKSRPRKRQE